MSIDILMPALSPTMESGKIAKWLKQEGDKVAPGDMIAEIETDKAMMEVESADEGVLGKILVGAGTEDVKVNQVIAILLEEGEESSTLSQMGRQVATPASPAIPVAAAGADAPAVSMIAAPAQPEIKQEQDPDIPTGTVMKMMTVREALRDAMAEEMRRDENVFLMGEEVAEYQGAYKVSQGLLEEFGSRRVVDTPITEQGFAGLGVGAAFAGLRPIVEFMTFNFAMQAIDQIINSASGGQMSAPMVFRGPNGAAARVGAQHSQDYAAWYSHIPGLKVIMPYSAADAKGLLKAAIRDDNPVIFLENELIYGQQFEVPELDDFILPIGKARLFKEGTDVTIVSFGAGMRQSIASVEALSQMGVDAELIDLRTIRPMDLASIVTSVKKTGRLVTVEEGFPQSCVGTEIITRVVAEAFDYLDAPPLSVAGKDVPMPYAANLEKLALPTVADVIEAVKTVTYKI